MGTNRYQASGLMEIIIFSLDNDADGNSFEQTAFLYQMLQCFMKKVGIFHPGNLNIQTDGNFLQPGKLPVKEWDTGS